MLNDIIRFKIEHPFLHFKTKYSFFMLSLPAGISMVKAYFFQFITKIVIPAKNILMIAGLKNSF